MFSPSDSRGCMWCMILTTDTIRFSKPSAFLGLKLKGITYQEVLSRIKRYQQLKKLLQPKRCEEIRKLTTHHGEEDTTGCFLDYKKTKETHQIEFMGNLKATGGVNADGAQFMFVLTNLEMIKKNTIKNLSTKRNSLIKDSKMWGSKS